MRRWIVVVVAAVALVVVGAAAVSACDCGTFVAQGERSRVDVDEVWPFWVTLSGLVLAIGTLSLWDTRRRRRGPKG